MALAGNRLFPDLIEEEPSPDTCIIAVVPAYDEPGITSLLNSLAECEPPGCRVEIILVINAPPAAPEEALTQNARSKKSVEEWRAGKESPFFNTFIIDLGLQANSKWGVGMARKTGMDEALSRFLRAGRPEGIILSLDADCTVDRNYFTAVETELLNNPKRKGCSIFFEHPLSGNEFSGEIYTAAAIYELHLRYFLQGAKFAGYPWVHHTVGSSFAVRASAYQAAGGMNRRQAGEDFYFIRKLIPAGGYFNLNSTTVYPSPRPSGRTPFGTGTVVSEITGSGPDSFTTYNPQSFLDLGEFFRAATGSYCAKGKLPGKTWEVFPASVKAFLPEPEWVENMESLINNTSGPESFRKRYFTWFNMFLIIKYLNFAHREGIFDRLRPDDATVRLLTIMGYSGFPETITGLVGFLRSLERA